MTATQKLADLVSISDDLTNWFTGFKRKFNGSNPKETGITDQLLMGLPDWVDARPTSGAVEGREGHDFVLEFTHQGRLCTLYMQAKNIHDDVVDFIAGYRTIDEPTKSPMSRLEKALLQQLRDLRQEYRDSRPRRKREINEDYDEKEQELERFREREAERRAEEEEKKISLQAARLHTAICDGDYGPTVRNPNYYVGGGYVIYGHSQCIGYVPIGRVWECYHQALNQATSIADLRKRTSDTIFNSNYCLPIWAILTDSTRVPTDTKWELRRFQN
ncbi:hypothetical protein FRC08_013869 [Ceratobasidium sp. 394]|nr:hypothetical protein FRC08_013869 [Ceratobasidium sp. 394]